MYINLNNLYFYYIIYIYLYLQREYNNNPLAQKMYGNQSRNEHVMASQLLFLYAIMYTVQFAFCTKKEHVRNRSFPAKKIKIIYRRSDLVRVNTVFELSSQ